MPLVGGAAQQHRLSASRKWLLAQQAPQSPRKEALVSECASHQKITVLLAAKSTLCIQSCSLHCGLRRASIETRSPHQIMYERRPDSENGLLLAEPPSICITFSHIARICSGSMLCRVTETDSDNTLSVKDDVRNELRGVLTWRITARAHNVYDDLSRTSTPIDDISTPDHVQECSRE